MLPRTSGAVLIHATWQLAVSLSVDIAPNVNGIWRRSGAGGAAASTRVLARVPGAVLTSSPMVEYPWAVRRRSTVSVSCSVEAVAAARRDKTAQQLNELVSKRERREATATAAAGASMASCQIRVVQANAAAPAQLASGFLVRLPCGPCLVTAAHVLGDADAGRRGCAARISGVAAVLSGALHGDFAADGACPGTRSQTSSPVRFKGNPRHFWRHDSVLDVVVVAVRANSSRRAHSLTKVSLPMAQLASIASLCNWTQGSPVQLTHRLGTTVAIVRSAASSAGMRAASLQTRSGAPLILDYDAPLAAGTSGAAVYDTCWHVIGVHIRGDEEKAQGRGVSIDAVRELIEVGSNVPLSCRVRMVQPAIELSSTTPPARSRSVESMSTTAALLDISDFSKLETDVEISSTGGTEKPATISSHETQGSAAYDRPIRDDNAARPISLPLTLTPGITPESSCCESRSFGPRVLPDHVQQTRQTKRGHRSAPCAPSDSPAFKAALKASPGQAQQEKERDNQPLKVSNASFGGASVTFHCRGTQAGGGRDPDVDDADPVSLHALVLREAARAAREAASQQLREVVSKPRQSVISYNR